MIEDEDFKLRHKAGGCSSFFKRDRKLCFAVVLVFILNGVKSALQRELDSFFGLLDNSFYPVRYVTKSAFSQARQKLSFKAFIEMNRQCADFFYDNTDFRRWRGKRVIAVDGSTFMLPYHFETAFEFPPSKGNPSMARISVAYDPFNELVLSCHLDSIHVDERTHLYRMLDDFKPGDLLLLDRGYPSFELLKELLRRNIHFCIRMKRGFNVQIDKFLNSRGKIKTVKFIQVDIRRKLMLYKVALPGGDEILLTDIRDRKLHVGDFAQLYHLRWGSEEGYKYLKARMETANFSGKTPAAIRQDYYAKVFIMTLEAVLRFPLDAKMRTKNTCAHLTKKNKHPRKINRTNALSLMMRCALRLFLLKEINEFLEAFDAIVLNTTESQIKDRASPRKPLRTIHYYQNYKRC